jgi:hypothetical protein
MKSENTKNIFTYIQHLVLDNHSVELRTQDKEIVLAIIQKPQNTFILLH